MIICRNPKNDMLNIDGINSQNIAHQLLSYTFVWIHCIRHESLVEVICSLFLTKYYIHNSKVLVHVFQDYPSTSKGEKTILSEFMDGEIK